MSKMIKTINDERVAFNLFSSTPQRCSYIPDNDPELLLIYKRVHDDSWGDHWVDSSGKSDNPPDFYSDEYNLMMVFMIVDDHARLDSKGLVNPQKKKDAEAYNELIKNLEPELIEHLEMITITTSTNLPSNEDHNYEFYVNEFRRVISKHLKKIKIYKKNHPTHQLIFFILDESALYVEVESRYHEAFNNKEEVRARYHYPFADQEMVSILKDSNLDFVIWWMPYRLPDENVPTVAIIRPSSLDMDSLIKYPSKLMLSTEE